MILVAITVIFAKFSLLSEGRYEKGIGTGTNLVTFCTYSWKVKKMSVVPYIRGK